MRVTEGDRVQIGGLSLDVLYTPGHTDDSYSYLLNDRVFTGDTLLIRGTGRTDFQNGSPYAQYDSIFNKLLKLPDETLIFPAHDYKGETVSSIGEEKRFNPRLQVKSVDEYADLMNNLKLPNPKMMDVVVTANLQVGLRQEEIARKGCAVSAPDALTLLNRPDTAFVDLRETSERERHGVIPGAVHAPYVDLLKNLDAGGVKPGRRALPSRSLARTERHNSVTVRTTPETLEFVPVDCIKFMQTRPHSCMTLA
jgi:sulfur dioxygenase